MNTRELQLSIGSAPSNQLNDIALEAVGIKPAPLLNRRERKLIELSLAIAGRNQDQILNHVRAMHSEGFASTELLEVALLVAIELNLPQALTWVNDGLEQVLDA